MAVAYKLSSSAPIGAPPLDVAGDTTQRLPLGTVVTGVDTSTAAYGEAEFKYVKFTGIVAAGSMALLDAQGKTGVITPAAATKGFFGLSMGTTVANSYGYVMIRGVHDGAAVLTGATPGVAPIYQSALTAGKITDAVTANAIYEGVAIRVTGVNSVGTVELNYPSCTGR